ncbi:MAG: GtrA family protein [Betaproteobacteria bacterium]|nr:GtrA family protein [Betaproteobacteria bacterium]
MLIRQGLKFGLVGAAATATHFLVMLFLVEVLRLDPVLATFPAFGIAFLVSYTGHFIWTFRARGPHQRYLLKYFGVALGGLAANAAIMYGAVHLLHWSYLVGLAIAIVLVPLLTFSAARLLVFRG